MKLNSHVEDSALIGASIDQVFAYLDDQTHLSAHMDRSSWMMGGGRMSIELDEGRGQRVGSHIRLAGCVFGMNLSLDEAVIEREPPRRKVWQTLGEPRLLVIGEYRMGFEIAPDGNGARLRVFIDYAPPRAAPARWLGIALGRSYAKWCTRSMVDEAVTHFESPAGGAGMHEPHHGAAS